MNKECIGIKTNINLISSENRINVFDSKSLSYQELPVVYSLHSIKFTLYTVYADVLT